MPSEEFTEVLGGWTGYRVSSVERVEAEGHRPEIRIELEIVAGRRRQCSGCGLKTRVRLG